MIIIFYKSHFNYLEALVYMYNILTKFFPVVLNTKISLT